MARVQWCRDHIDDVAENCCLERRSIEEVKQAAAFCDQHGEFSPLPTKPILTLIRIKDEQIREKTISHIKNMLNRKTPQGGKYTKTLTEREIKKVIDEIVKEVRMSDPPQIEEIKEQEKSIEKPNESLEKVQPTEIEIPTIQSKIIAPQKSNNEEKINYLSHNILKTEHLSYLNQMVSSGNAEDIFDALMIILDTVCQE